MFCINRFASRKLPAYFIGPEFLTATRHVKIKAKQYKAPPAETHDEYNMRIGRPQSPHLTIYAVELPSTLSITHRMTGAGFSFYTVAFSAASLILPEDFCYYMDLLEGLNVGLIPIYLVRAVLAFPICYHMCNGVRHLIWDLGFCLSMKGVYITGYLMLLTAFSLTTFVTLL